MIKNCPNLNFIEFWFISYFIEIKLNAETRKADDCWLITSMSGRLDNLRGQQRIATAHLKFNKIRRRDMT